VNRSVLAALCLLSAYSGLGGVLAGEPLAERLRKLDIKTPDLNQAWAKDLRARRDAVNLADRQAWQTVHTKEDWEKLKTPRREALRASLGELPSSAPRIELITTKSIKGDGYQIQNVIFETRPGFFVTANLYSPLGPSAPVPGILICTSHHNPKTQGELQEMGMTWARLGCLVLVPDQLGHGERRNHPFVDAKSYAGAFKPGRQDYYFRYNEALQLHLIGDSLIGWMAWDLMRGVDVLLSRPGIDKKVIILLGSVAGGGDPAGVTAALDERITAVAPFNFGGPQPETKYPLPADAEASFNYLGGGSWESTRNLRLSGRDGFLPWVIVGAAAPRGLVYGHEFAWDRERDPVWARLQKIYAFYNAADHLTSAHGRGAVTGRPPEASHCNNIGAEHRRQFYPALKRWFGMPEPSEEYQKHRPGEELLCWTDEARKKHHPRFLWEVAAELGQERVERARKRLATLLDEGENAAPAWARQQWARLLGHVEPSPKTYFVGIGVKVAPLEFGECKGDLGSYCLLLPEDGAERRKHPVVVAFAQGGIRELLKERADAVAALLQQGIGVCLAEWRGMASKTERGRGSSATAWSATELMLGETVLGHQLRGLRQLLAHLRKHESVDSKRLALWGESLAKANPPGRILEVPLDAEKMPDLAEPGASLLALLGCLFEPDVRAVLARGGLASYQSALRSPFVYLPHDAMVPGALTAGDWAELVAVLAPRAVRLEGLVDGRNRYVTAEEAAKAYEPARHAYRKTVGRLTLSQEPSGAEALTRWLTAALN
jgi:hypothetical protein